MLSAGSATVSAAVGELAVEGFAADSSVVASSLDKLSGRIETRGCKVSTRCGSSDTLKSVVELIVARGECDVVVGVDLEKVELKRRVQRVQFPPLGYLIEMGSCPQRPRQTTTAAVDALHDLAGGDHWSENCLNRCICI